MEGRILENPLRGEALSHQVYFFLLLLQAISRILVFKFSALYVVDLVRFRQLAAGDRLRAQYQQLSVDPNSLANLDQDLPNNMQHIVPIHSLPQEWLWCETWCSDESLKKAKTIDLVYKYKKIRKKCAKLLIFFNNYSVITR